MQQSDGSKKELTLLDPKRSNAINIGLTTLPPARTIRTAVFKMDSTIISREQIEVIYSHLKPVLQNWNTDVALNATLSVRFSLPDTSVGFVQHQVMHGQ